MEEVKALVRAHAERAKALALQTGEALLEEANKRLLEANLTHTRSESTLQTVDGDLSKAMATMHGANEVLAQRTDTLGAARAKLVERTERVAALEKELLSLREEVEETRTNVHALEEELVEAERIAGEVTKALEKSKVDVEHAVAAVDQAKTAVDDARKRQNTVAAWLAELSPMDPNHDAFVDVLLRGLPTPPSAFAQRLTTMEHPTATAAPNPNPDGSSTTVTQANVLMVVQNQLRTLQTISQGVEFLLQEHARKRKRVKTVTAAEDSKDSSSGEEEDEVTHYPVATRSTPSKAVPSHSQFDARWAINRHGESKPEYAGEDATAQCPTAEFMKEEMTMKDGKFVARGSRDQLRAFFQALDEDGKDWLAHLFRGDDPVEAIVRRKLDRVGAHNPYMWIFTCGPPSGERPSMIKVIVYDGTRHYSHHAYMDHLRKRKSDGF
jgi:hypothetical protein